MGLLKDDVSFFADKGLVVVNLGYTREGNAEGEKEEMLVADADRWHC